MELKKSNKIYGDYYEATKKHTTVIIYYNFVIFYLYESYLSN